MYLNHLRPSSFDILNRQLSSVLRASAILSWVIDVDFFHLFRIHMPVENSLLVLYMYPRWGEQREMYRRENSDEDWTFKR